MRRLFAERLLILEGHVQRRFPTRSIAVQANRPTAASKRRSVCRCAPIGRSHTLEPVSSMAGTKKKRPSGAEARSYFWVFAARLTSWPVTKLFGISARERSAWIFSLSLLLVLTSAPPAQGLIDSEATRINNRGVAQMGQQLPERAAATFAEAFKKDPRLAQAAVNEGSQKAINDNQLKPAIQPRGSVCPTALSNGIRPSPAG